MEGDWLLDAAGCADGRRALTVTAKYARLPAGVFSAGVVAARPVACAVCVAVMLASALAAGAQSRMVSPSVAQQIRTSPVAGRWQRVVDTLGALHTRTADENYTYGMALARLKRWREADAALEAGERQTQGRERILVERFPVALAGVAFEQKQYAQAARELRRALRLNPEDKYAANFLGTVYFLEDNLPAAVKEWNRVGKPELAAVRVEPPLSIAPALLDGAFAFAPESLLTLQQMADSEARLHGLGVFPQYHFELRPRKDGRFDMVFRAEELDGFGGGWLARGFMLLRGLPFEETDLEYDNLHGQALNLRGMVRWDAQKRRIYAEAAGPWMQSAVRRYRVSLDLRNENWALRRSFAGPAPVVASLNLRRAVGAATIGSNARDRFRWRVGAEISDRELRNVTAGGVLTPSLLASGWELKQTATVSSTLVRIPERRFTMTATANSQAARLWSSPEQGFEKLQGTLGWRWRPRATGKGYETQQEIRAGGIFGEPPFDELYELGLERDNDLPMRAHIGTRDGVKGSAPLGRDYFLASWETDRTLYSNGLMAVKLGPFVDTGRMGDALAVEGWQKWLVDTGAEVKLRVFGTTLAFSYGKDLRTGNNAFYLRLLPSGD